MQRRVLYYSTAILTLSFLAGCATTTTTQSEKRTLTVSPTGQVYVAKPPPPRAELVAMGGPPDEGHVWTDGHWTYHAASWIWVPGYWQMPAQRGETWVTGHWDETERGWYWTPGHWE